MIGTLITLLIYLLVVGVILWLALYIIDNLPLAAPFGQVARVVVIVIGCLVVIVMLLQLLGGVGSFGDLRLHGLR